MQIILCLYLCDSFSSLDQFVQGLVGAHFKDDIDKILILKEMVEANHVLGSQ